MEAAYIKKCCVQSIALVGIAMCWAYKHPDRTDNLFEKSDAIGVEAIVPELRELVSGRYSGWLNMAEMLVSRYSEEEGFPKYEDLA